MKKQQEIANDDVMVSVMLSKHELKLLKYKANAEGISYKTLLGKIVHKYVSGQLRPVN